VLGDVDDQPQVGTNHALARRGVVVADDATPEFLLLVRGQQRGLVDLLEVQLQTGLNGD
jgi:hypothetical protein